MVVDTLKSMTEDSQYKVLTQIQGGKICVIRQGEGWRSPKGVP